MSSIKLDYDALPIIDGEYNNPVVQSAVLGMVQEEMKSFAPPADNYLSHLSYPALKFVNCPAFKAEFQRVSKTLSNNSNVGMQKTLDFERYSVPSPAPGLEDDIQAWRSAVKNAKSQLEHQRNRTLNLDLCHELGGTINSKFPNCVEGMAKREQQKVNDLQMDKNKINAERLREQKANAPTIMKLNGKRNDATIRVLQLNSVVRELEHVVAKRQKLK